MPRLLLLIYTCHVYSFKDLSVVFKEMRDPENQPFLICIASRFSDDESKKRAMQLAEGQLGVVPCRFALEAFFC